MTRLADLSQQELTQRLRGSGLRLRTGPMVVSITSPLPAVQAGIGLHYAEHPVEGDQVVADFHVEVGRPSNWRRWFKPQVVFRVDGQDPFTPLPGDQGFPMLEWGLNWCLSGATHHFLTLHAAVLERNGRALLLPAPSGSGKSTLCAGLAFSGWRLLSDELALFDPATGEIVPLARPISLKNASIEALRRFAPDAAFGAVVHETTKGSVCHVRPPAEAVRRVAERSRPGWVVLPKFEPGVPARLEPLSKAQAMMRLVESAFNYNVYRRRGFDLLAEAVEHSHCYQFHYSRLDEAAGVFQRLADAGLPD